LKNKNLDSEKLINKNIINFNEIELLKNPSDDTLLIIKNGSYSKILLGLYWDKIITIKQVDLNKVEKEKFVKEISSLFNPKINDSKYYLKIYGFSEMKNSIFLISKFNQSCNLFNLIHEKKLLLTIKDLIKYIGNIVEAINIRHNEKLLITYKDLKLENVFISKEGDYAFLDDFAFSKHFFTNKTKNKKHCGTIYYMAPELLKGEDFTLSSDIYSFGILLFEIFSKSIPYENLSDLEIIKKVVAGQRPNLDNLRNDTPKEFVELMIKCWNQVPSKRLTSDDIVYFMEF